MSVGQITPLVYLSTYNIIICCKYGRVANEVDNHLKSEHPDINATERTIIVERIKQIPGIVRSQAELKEFRFPQATIQPIPELEAPKRDGLRCSQCPDVYRHIKNMRDHCRDVHGWVNERGRGRVTRAEERRGRELPWITGVHCQRFFNSRAARGWFQVRAGAVAAQDQPSQPESDEQRVSRIYTEQTRRFETGQKKAIEEESQKKEPNRWLNRVGWARHLKGLDPERLVEATGPVQDDEPGLGRICESIARVAEAAQQTVWRIGVGHAVLFEIERKDRHVKPNTPFNTDMEEKTWKQYVEVMQKVVRIITRVDTWDEDDRPPYELTERQGDLLDELQEIAEGEGEGEGEGEEARMDRLCLDFVVSLLDHEYNHNPYESVLLSALAVMGRQKDGYVGPMDYTPIYSAVIKMARIFVVQQSYAEQQDEIRERIQTGMDEAAATKDASSLYKIVRKKVHRFMVRADGPPGPGPGPMDWIFDARTYGMKIRYNTPGEGKIAWNGTTVSFQKMRFSMEQLCDMMHGMVDEMRQDMGYLIRMEGRGHEEFPTIPWERVEDDHSEEKVGYSFLADDRNTWVAKGSKFVMQRILSNPDDTEKWIQGGEQPYREAAIREYGLRVEGFREKWLAMAHMTLGQPARGPEILEIRFRNTGQGGVRNAFVDNGMVCFVTSYHKNMRSMDRTKVIYRYLPREMGELLVWYLWLVLPFWQHVQGVIKQSNETSAFLWADEIVPKRWESEAVDRASPGPRPGGGISRVIAFSPGGTEASGEEDMTAQAAKVKSLFRERKWTSDRMRRILQEHFQRFIGGVAMTIAAWRHIAIGISRQFLNGAFKESTDEDDDDEDDLWDLQGGHGTHVAGMIYARLLQQGTAGTASQQAGFRRISIQWHRFFGLGLAEVGLGRKRRQDEFDTMREESRARRLRRLYDVDIRGRLRQLFGDSEAQFRGRQEEVIRAIIRGHSPIIQIAGTGEGKSLSFMLPAFCSPEGTTIVVVPLVALRADMQRRCEEAQIDVHVWKSGGPNRAASIVLVTPESAISKGFGEFINRLQGRQQLDRIVVDECHMLLDSTEGFRRRMQELGGVLGGVGVQLVFLTATLAWQDEGLFCRRAEIRQKEAVIIRSRTTRKNIRYRVREVSGGDSGVEKVAIEEAQQILRNSTGKVIMYCGRIKQAEDLAKRMNWPVFYSKVDSTEGKARRLKEWIEKGRGIVATNAMGAGIDIPDIRGVVHVGWPRRLRDYAQESGRGGRDGLASSAVIVCGKGTRQTEGQGESVEDKRGREEMLRFMRSGGCRRVVLDGVMDGREDRIGCEEGEERCDICERETFRIGDKMDMGASEEEEASEEEAEVEEKIWQEVLAREKRVLRREQGKQAREGQEIYELRRMMEAWAGQCGLCKVRGGGDSRHSIWDCVVGGTEWKEIRRQAAIFKKGLFGGRRMEEYGGCYANGCGGPQAWCDSWVTVEDDGGSYRRTAGGWQCQFRGVLVEGSIGMLVVDSGLGGNERVEEMMREDGVDLEDDDSRWRWFGKKIRWGGVETNNLCWVFYMLNKMVEENRGEG